MAIADHLNPDRLFSDEDRARRRGLVLGRQQTTVTETGRLGWTDGTGPPEINHAHHPEELLHSDPDPPSDEAA